MGAHAEYVKLCRSAADGKPCDLIEAVYERYVSNHREREPIEVWKFNRQIRTMRGGARLRVQANVPFLLHWTTDDWVHYTDNRSTATGVEIDFVDIPVAAHHATIRFTFLWVNDDRWEGHDYAVEVES
jgi:glucoamylase